METRFVVLFVIVSGLAAAAVALIREAVAGGGIALGALGGLVALAALLGLVVLARIVVVVERGRRHR